MSVLKRCSIREGTLSIRVSQCVRLIDLRALFITPILKPHGRHGGASNDSPTHLPLLRYSMATPVILLQMNIFFRN